MGKVVFKICLSKPGMLWNKNSRISGVFWVEKVDENSGLSRTETQSEGGNSHDARNTEPAFIDLAFVSPKIPHGGGLHFGEAPVVAAKPNEGVVGNLEVTKSLAKSAHGAVEGDEFAVVVLTALIEILEGGDVFFAGFKRKMGRAIPNDSEERLLIGGLLFDELQGFIDNDSRGVALELMNTFGSSHERIEIEEVGDRHPFLESEASGPVGIVRQDGNARATETIEVPLSKMSGGVAGILERGGDGFLREPESVAVTGNSGPVVGPTGENRRPRG